jgi:hypothetical protein
MYTDGCPMNEYTPAGATTEARDRKPVDKDDARTPGFCLRLNCESVLNAYRFNDSSVDDSALKGRSVHTFLLELIQRFHSSNAIDH